MLESEQIARHKASADIICVFCPFRTRQNASDWRCHASPLLESVYNSLRGSDQHTLKAQKQWEKAKTTISRIEKVLPFPVEADLPNGWVSPLKEALRFMKTGMENKLMWNWEDVPSELQNAFSRKGNNGPLYRGIKIREPWGNTGDDILRELKNKDTKSLSQSPSKSSGSVYTPEFDPDVRRGSMEAEDLQPDDFEFDLFSGKNSFMVLPVSDLPSILNDDGWSIDIRFTCDWMHTPPASRMDGNPPTTVFEPTSTLESSFFGEEYDSYLGRMEEQKRSAMDR